MKKAVDAATLLGMISGIIISKNVFDFLNLSESTLAVKIHTFSAFRELLFCKLKKSPVHC